MVLQVLQFRPDCLEALHARARANRESGNFQSAISDLTEALNIIKVKEEMKKKIEEEKNNNNNDDDDDDEESTGKSKLVGAARFGFPVGATQCDILKFVDDSASEISHRSNNY